MAMQANTCKFPVADDAIALNGEMILSIDLVNKLRQNGGVLSLTCRYIGEGSDRYLLVESDTAIAANIAPKLEPIKPVSTNPIDEATKYLAKLKLRIKEVLAISDRTSAIKAFDDLYGKIHSEPTWSKFKAVPAIAKEATDLLSEAKARLVLGSAIPPEPIDLSNLLSKLDVEIERLNLDKKAEREARFGAGIANVDLSQSDLEEWLADLQTIDRADAPHQVEAESSDVKAIAPQPSNCDNILARIKSIRTVLAMTSDDVQEIANKITGKPISRTDSIQLEKILKFLLEKIENKAAIADADFF